MYARSSCGMPASSVTPVRSPLPSGKGLVDGAEVLFFDVVGQVVDLFAHVFVVRADFHFRKPESTSAFIIISCETPLTMHAYLSTAGPASRSAAPSGGCTVLATDFAQTVARGVVQFGGERTRTHPGGVGLEDTEYFTDGSRGHAQSGAGSGGHRVGRGNEGVGAEVDVQHRSLCALGQDLFPLGDGLVEVVFAVDEGERFEHFECGEPFAFQFVQVEFDAGVVLVSSIARCFFTRAW